MPGGYNTIMIRPSTPTIAFIIIPPAAVTSFAPSHSHGSPLLRSSSGYPSRIVLSYTNNNNSNSDGDDATNANGRSENSFGLSHSHHGLKQSTPTQHQRTSPFLSLIDKDSVDWKEWQYSFSQNGFTDFLPQFASHLDCLAIDVHVDVHVDVDVDNQDPVAAAISSALESPSASDDTINTRLPWQYGDDDDFNLMEDEATSSIKTMPLSATSSPSLSHSNSNRHSHYHTSNETTSINKVDADAFDCILDGGVMNGIVSSLPSTVTWHSRTAPPAILDLVKLMNEANQAIREYGIYVAITETSIPDHARGYLDAMGQVMGLDWNYDLDGLTSDLYHVSVARKYYTGAVNMDDLFCNGTTDGHDGSSANLLKP